MTAALHDIPPAPRHPARLASLVVGWPLLLAGLFLTVYGGLVTLMFFFAAHADGPRIEIELDERAATVPGQVMRVESLADRGHNASVERAYFRYQTPDHRTADGECLVPRDRFAPGDEAEVQFLPEPPWHARLKGGHVSFVTGFVTPAFRLTIVPGLLLIAAWALGVLRTRRVLVHGDAALAEVLHLERARFPIPTMLTVHFRFRDHHAVAREGRHWVRERTPLGERLLAGARRLVVIHDREHPARYRLAQPTDFAPRPTAGGELPSTAERG